MALDSVKIEVNLEEKIDLSAGAQVSFFCQNGDIMVIEKNALWRIERQKMTKTKIAGGGERWPMAFVGEKIALEEAHFDEEKAWFGCEAEEGVYWCIRDGMGAIHQIDTKKGEIEVLVLPRPLRAPSGGFYGGAGREAIVVGPRGPLLPIMGPNGPQVYFYDLNELRVADLRTKEIRLLKSVPYGVIHDPSVLKPSKTMLRGIDTPQEARINPRFTWVSTYHVENEYGGPDLAATSLVDLDSGQHVLLSRTCLHPLLAITSSLILAAEVEPPADMEEVLEPSPNSWIVLVDWSIPSDLASDMNAKSSESRYLLTRQRIKRLAPLSFSAHPNLDRFIFHTSSNQLHNIGVRSVDIYFNVFDYVSSVFDQSLSKLLAPECPLPYDLTLTHSASNSSWNIHYDVFILHEHFKEKEDIDRLVTLIKYSSLPSASIFGFVKFLYFSLPAELTNASESFMPFCHCIQLCNQIGLGPEYSHYILWLLETKIIPNLPTEILLQNILTLWLVEQDPSPESVATYSKTSPLMSLLASRCRKYASDAEIQRATSNFDFSKATSLPMHQVVAMCVSLSQFLSPGSSEPLDLLELSSSPPPMSRKPWLKLYQGTPPSDKYSFVFTIEGCNTQGLICNSLLLYCYWRWFERLCKVEKCQEVLTRHVSMPAVFRPAALTAILASCYSIPSVRLSFVDLAAIDHYCEEFHLLESPCFAELVEICRKRLKYEATANNCIYHLVALWLAGFNMDFPIFADTFELAYKNRSTISDDLLSKLPIEITTMLFP